jgi:dephospho-CoA kinase
MKLPKIIAVVGMTNSGKGTVVDYLTNKLDCPSVYLGGMVYEEVAQRGLDIVKDEIWVREDMRKQEGMAVMAKRAAIKAKELLSSGAKTVVLDGVYSWAEDKFLREEFGDEIIVLAVVVQKQIRYQRALKRVDKKSGGQTRKYTLENIMTRDITEIENIEKGGPIAYADYFVLNDDDFDNLYAQIDRII